MELFAFDYHSHRIVMTGSSWSGQEELFVDGVVVSQKRNLGFNSEHSLQLPSLGEFTLAFTIDIRRASVCYELRTKDQVLVSDSVPLPEAYTLRQVAPMTDTTLTLEPSSATLVQPKKSNSWIILAGVGLKLLKSAKVLKAGLALTTLSVYSILFSVEFALALIAILVFHEYGHLRAMKKFGIPTKGMYLIPFVGGLAVGDKPNTRWQDVYISLMGPIYGLFMTVVCYLAYLATDNHFIGMVASFSALINLFNLLPIHPLDGGRVIKALVFSGRKKIALIFLLTLSALFFVLSFTLGFALIGFFIILGVIDIVSEWRTALAADITPLTSYGIWFCLLWYLATVVAFLTIIVLLAYSELPGSELALNILNS